MYSDLDHGLVPSQGQQHAGTQLVLSQREEELLCFVAGTHQDVDLQERGRLTHFNGKTSTITWKTGNKVENQCMLDIKLLSTVPQHEGSIQLLNESSCALRYKMEPLQKITPLGDKINSEK